MTKTYRRRKNYHRARKALIVQLGGKCACCGSKRRLEFHHLQPRQWVPARTARWVRIARYRREAAEGLIELRCRHCNSVAGRPAGRPGYRFVHLEGLKGYWAKE